MWSIGTVRARIANGQEKMAHPDSVPLAKM